MTSTTIEPKVDRLLLFSQCEFFIDYRSTQTQCDRSLRLGNELQKKYGARIVEQPNASTTTHIIYRNGRLETRLFAQRHRLPLIGPIWLEECVKRRRLVPFEKYQVSNDENQPPTETIPLDRLTISKSAALEQQQQQQPETPESKQPPLNSDSAKKHRKQLYTPVRDQFDQGNPHEYFDHQQRVITLDNLGIPLPDADHMLIHRYGCSVARRQNKKDPPNAVESRPPQDELLNAMKQILQTEMSIPSQSQTSPIIHFANPVRRGPPTGNQLSVSPSTSFDLNSQQHLEALGIRPQSTPVSSGVTSPILRPSVAVNLAPLNSVNPSSTDVNQATIIENKKKQCQIITPMKTRDYSSFTKVTPLNLSLHQNLLGNKGTTQSRIIFEVCHDEADDNRVILPTVQEMIEQLQSEDEHRFLPRPPPLMTLSQGIQARHPEQLLETKINNQLSSIKDLPNVPANYSFVFHHFSAIQLDEAKRMTRRMGDCFSSETIDLFTTHVIVPDDNPQLSLTLDIFLALIYGCRLVTFEWLKASTRIGEWLGAHKFEPKRLFLQYPSLNLYRKARQQQKSINIFLECGLIYLTSIVQDRSILLKLITLLGGNITLSRNRAKIVVGRSSKALQVIIYPQVTEQWVIDSIKAGHCLSADDYLINESNDQSLPSL